MRPLSFALFTLAAVGTLLSPSGAVAAEPLEYNRDIRPILAENCFACHGADSAAREAGLRIDRREDAIEMGAIMPGSPDDSELLRRVLSEDADEQMPPPAVKKKLTAAQKEVLRRWIAEGAEYEPHWSFLAPSRPPVPAVSDATWPRNPIDQFVLAAMQKRELTPAPEADRRTLARRLSLDLVGLPPDPAMVDAFVNDPAPNAYERLVDTLLKSQQWGEHRGRYWLDAARYADTHGIHFDNYREIWSYRDWVINAFNRNLPFDQFTIEQLAGDLLPDATLDQRIASGFNRCNITTNEGGVIAEEYLVLYTRDRTETVSQVWMALTAGCAVCHDHKFDPLSQREFYELAAFFNNSTQGAMDGNVKDTPPILQVPRAEDRPRFDALRVEIPQARTSVETRRADARGDFDTWRASASADQLVASLPTEQLYLHAPLNEGEGQAVAAQVDGQPVTLALADSASWQAGPAGGHALQPQGAACELADFGDFEKDQAFTCAVWIKPAANDGAGAIAARMDNASDYRGWDFWMQQRRVGMHIINRWPDNAVKVVGKNQVPANEWTHVTVSYDGSGKASGVKVYYNGVEQSTNVEADKLSETTRTSVPFKIGQRSTEQPLSGTALHDLRVYRLKLDPAQVTALARNSQLAAILGKPEDQRSEAEKTQLYDWWLGALDTSYQALTAQVAQLEKEEADIKARGTIAHVMQERNEPPKAFILNRGEYDQRGEQTEPNTPAAMPPMPEELPRNRLGFAHWLLRPEHPLTARVTVNRFWEQVFGQGFVRTSGDFGVTGELPSHPELLDWLAVEFRESGWDVKQFFKLMVMSATYRQAAVTTPEKLERDPDNRLLSRGPRFRMDAEMIRDYALAASGVLVPKIGGPSVKPYQPPGVWEAVAMIGSNTRDYRPDSGENLYRRSMYTFWKRSAPPASLEIFNAPSREVCEVRRERTNTPLQALVTLNDPQHIEAARALAQRALREGGESAGQRIDFLMHRLVARPARDVERPIIETTLGDLLTHYQGHEEDAKALIAVGESKPDESLDAANLAAWTMLTNKLMNLDEVLTK